MPDTLPTPEGISSTHRTHKESSTEIWVPKEGAFLNPVQQFNRDLSVAVIRAWNELRKEELEAKWKARRESGGKGRRRKEKKNNKTAQERPIADSVIDPDQPAAGPFTQPFRAPKITILEALSATGLRSIRYGKEIPDVRVVLANDLSPSACEAMKMNVAYNTVGEGSHPHHESSFRPAPAENEETHTAREEESDHRPQDGVTEEEKGNAVLEERYGRREGCDGKVRVNEGDACTLMYQHRDPRNRVDVVDLDPYGTAAPFIDAAVSCIADGGLLCVTCTDLAVLAGTQYPEKCFSNYGGSSANAEYSHEAALRLVLNSLSTSAARYGRYMTPLLSFSIDFYVRLFVRVDTRAEKVKQTASNIGLAYVCHYCQSPTLQPFGRIVGKETRAGDTITSYRSANAVGHGTGCNECGSQMQVAGPMWLGPIQNRDFAERTLQGIEGDKENYGTWTRMHGMLNLAKDELPDPFYFTTNKVCGFFHASPLSQTKAASALLNAGYLLSRSHSIPGSIKTNAPRAFIYDMVREHIKTNPVRMDKLAEKSAARALLAKEISHTIDFRSNAGAAKLLDRNEKGAKVVFYQENPTANWGPGSRAKNIATSTAVNGSKGKRKSDGEDEGEHKKMKGDAETAAAVGRRKEGGDWEDTMGA